MAKMAATAANIARWDLRIHSLLARRADGHGVNCVHQSSGGFLLLPDRELWSGLRGRCVSLPERSGSCASAYVAECRLCPGVVKTWTGRGRPRRRRVITRAAPLRESSATVPTTSSLEVSQSCLGPPAGSEAGCADALPSPR